MDTDKRRLEQAGESKWREANAGNRLSRCGEHRLWCWQQKVEYREGQMKPNEGLEAVQTQAKTGWDFFPMTTAAVTI